MFRLKTRSSLYKNKCGYLRIFKVLCLYANIQLSSRCGFMVTWICCPVQDSNLETQESFWESFTLYLPFSPNVVRLLKSSWVNEYYVYERLRSFKKYVTWQGGKVTKNDKEEWWGSITSGVTHLNFFISHFFFNSVSPSK